MKYWKEHPFLQSNGSPTVRMMPPEKEVPDEESSEELDARREQDQQEAQQRIQDAYRRTTELAVRTAILG